MSSNCGRKGQPARARIAAKYLIRGYSIRAALRLAGYSLGVANRGTAALRHSQVLQRAVLCELANDSAQSIWFNKVRFCRVVSAFHGLDLQNLRTEYYGPKRDVRIVLLAPTQIGLD